MLYVTLRGRWCDIIILNVPALTEDKSDSKELDRVFDQCHTKVLLRDFNSKVWTEDIFKPTIGNDSLYEIANDKGVKVVNFATSESLSRVQCSTSHQS
jgi:hypothetical protein